MAAGIRSCNEQVWRAHRGRVNRDPASPIWVASLSSEIASKRTPTILGFSAILMWSLLALLTAASGTVPPFQLSAMCFTLGGVLGLLAILRGNQGFAAFKQPPSVWLLGVGGLFGYHFFYFTALRSAPPVEAGLIAYLWPLLIVLFSALLPGERLRWFHLVGALLGLLGTGLIVTSGSGLAVNWQYSFGYGMALLCALTWSGYSVLSRRFATVPTEIVAGFCLATAAFSLACHLALETTVWPQSGTQWMAIVGLGTLPVGLAFYVWDYGVKHGDILVLGAASYAAPMLSTLVLILFGFGAFTLNIGAACVLITGGAVLASLDMLKGRR